ncbi:ABC transporter permease [Baekduia soli]|uniref:ABC transporter permease n=1 Tax=Baekduia soli TaxID=496014 RepID=A0A5B8U171_9ACTN|nr:ABC transporter permease [Baekduia soli]
MKAHPTTGPTAGPLAQAPVPRATRLDAAGSGGSGSAPVLELILTNLRRRKARTAATALGIALGVATIVALLSIGSGIKRTAGELVHLGQADLGVFQSGVTDPTASLLPLSLGARLEARPDVAEATPLLLVIEGVRQDPAAVVFGARPEGFFARRLVAVQGTSRLGGRSVAVGDRLARELRLKPGGTLTVKRRRFTVAGIYHTGVYFEDTGAVMDLVAAQRLTDRRGEATTFAVQLATGAHHAAAVKAIRRALPGLQIIGTADDAERAGANGELVRNTVSIVATLALILGGLGVTNTMAMAVLERRRELALLNALGWRRGRVALLVLAEGVITSIGGAAVGLLLGTLGAGWLAQGLGVSAVVTPHVTMATIGQAVLIGGAVGVLGGLYPAWRGTSISGAELLAAGT